MFLSKTSSTENQTPEQPNTLQIILNYRDVTNYLKEQGIFRVLSALQLFQYCENMIDLIDTSGILEMHYQLVVLGWYYVYNSLQGSLFFSWTFLKI